MNNLNTFTVNTANFIDMRLDKALPLLFEGNTRSYYDSLFKKELIKVNSKLVKKSHKLALNDSIAVEIPHLPEITLAKTQMPLSIIFEDEHLLVINKPSGLVVHPAPGHYEDTLVNGLLYYCDLESEKDNLRPGIVHRLDKDTSGLLITCKTKQAHEGMSRLFMNREIQKSYIAICLGKVKDEVIEAPIARHKHFRQKMSVSFAENAKSATTIVTLIYHDHEISLARLNIITGRTHQIRVHMQYKKTPVLGDNVYGYLQANSSFKVTRQYLHAHEVSFIHPITLKSMHLKAELADDMKDFLNARKVDLTLI